MEWHRISIQAHEAEVAQQCAVALIEQAGRIYGDAGLPSGFRIWHRRCSSLRHEYYLSPTASRFLLPLLTSFEAVACAQPDFRMMKEVIL